MAAKKDSVEICFVPVGDYRPLVRERLPADHAAVQPGDFVDRDGNRIGRHEGAIGFTIGQRKGLGQGFGKRAYVTAVDAITMAGGQNRFAGDEVYVLRGSPQRKIPIDLKRATSGSHPEENLVVIRGDLIVVP